MYYFCTYFDKNYLNKGLALYSSLKEQCGDFRLYVLCMDDTCYRMLSRMALPGVTLISISEFERDDPALRDARKSRSLVEYYFTCTPSLPLFILDRWPEIDVITYLDSDLYFFAAPDPIYDEMGDRSVLIIEHRFPPAIADRNIFGKYNVGYLSFRRDETGRACLKWWRERCIEWCYDRLDGNRFAEQKYLDDWPERFQGVAVLQHKGGGLSPWNIAGYHITVQGSQPMVDNQPLIFYHFHGFRKINRWFFDTEMRTYKARLGNTAACYIYRPYLNVLERQTIRASTYNDNETITVEQIRTNSPAKKSLIYKIKRTCHQIKDWLTGDLIFIGRTPALEPPV